MTAAAPLFTIDETHSRDLDDAIGVERIAEGWRVHVAIANPSLEVAIGSDVDQRARSAGATLYRARAATAPMLPREISEARSTLTAGQPRAALLIQLQIDQTGHVLHTELALEEVVVSRRLAYSDVPRTANDRGDELSTPIADSIALARQLLQNRRARGALAIYDQKRMLLTDEEGRIQHYDADAMIGHIVVQEFMIAANAAVAELAATREIPFLYRTHEPRLSAPRGIAAADSFEAWMAGGTESIAAASQHLHLVVKKARYSSELKGHYGLNLPAYAHVTSPLRRYADLVNQRQLVAHPRDRQLPYAQEDLEAIGQELYDLVIAQSEETSEHFKGPVIERARTALNSGGLLPLSGMADNELGQAVKAALQGGSFVPPLVEELLRRMRHGLLADKITGRLIEGNASIPKELTEGIAQMVRERPALAVSFVNHAKAVGLVDSFEVQFEGVPTRPGAPSAEFQASAVLREAAGGKTHRAHGRGSRKKDAEQAATLLVFCDFIGAERPIDAVVQRAELLVPSSHPPQEPPPGNPKGALLELCQKLGLTPPVFETASTGPANAPVFTCVCTLDNGGIALQASSQPAGTRKAAEALAAHAMLEQIAAARAAQSSHAPAAASSAERLLVAPLTAPAGANPISQLQELAQKQRVQPPSYTFEELAKPPASSFRCRVVVDLGTRLLDVQATAATKQAAKSSAAAAALDQHRRGAIASSV